ncbi:MAG: hypothetical protein NT029_08490 [Armatimonadetes bacterium]|nr:hypothetical protein [Armatimonadota bacterium]
MPWLAAALAAIVVVAAASPAVAASSISPSLRVFGMDGARSILDEEHFGIVGGRLSCGVAHSDLSALRGVWAPPYVSSDLRLDLRLFGRSLPAERYEWLPMQVVRHGRWGGVAVTATTLAATGSRSLALEAEMRNDGSAAVDVPLELAFSGTLDKSPAWEFARPASSTPAPSRPAPGGVERVAAGLAMALRTVGVAGTWDAGGSHWSASVRLRPGQVRRVWAVLALGPEAEARAECARLAADPDRAMEATRRHWSRRADALFQSLPRLEASDPRLVAFYNRSLVHLLTNRWDVPEFMLRPYYSTGSVKGGCVCCYLWNYGEVWEILPLADAAAARAHILHYLKCDISTHFAFDPVTGAAFGPWYPVNQEKILGSIHHYVRLTGDAALLRERVNGRSVLEWVVHHAVVLDDPAKPVAMIDYGPSNSHLELRRGYPYNHVMPDLNGRRYQGYLWAQSLCELAGEPRPWLGDRAARLKALLKREMWDARSRWFAFVAGGKRDLRWTIQMYKLFGSGVLDAEEEEGLLSHLNDREFLSAYGMHSLAKGDPAYDPADVDNGGPGACTCFPPQVIEKLCRAGRPAEAADILERILWWGERLPYWGDSIVAERIDYRRDTPLQCTLDGATGAQAVIFGLFGIEAHADGSVTVDPHPPAFSPRMALRGLRIRGRTLDIRVDGGSFTVRSSAGAVRSRVGAPVTVGR